MSPNLLPPQLSSTLATRLKDDNWKVQNRTKFLIEMKYRKKSFCLSFYFSSFSFKLNHFSIIFILYNFILIHHHAPKNGLLIVCNTVFFIIFHFILCKNIIIRCFGIFMLIHSSLKIFFFYFLLFLGRKLSHVYDLCVTVFLFLFPLYVV